MLKDQYMSIFTRLYGLTDFMESLRCDYLPGVILHWNSLKPVFQSAPPIYLSSNEVWQTLTNPSSIRLNPIEGFYIFEVCVWGGGGNPRTEFSKSFWLVKTNLKSLHRVQWTSKTDASSAVWWLSTLKNLFTIRSVGVYSFLYFICLFTLTCQGTLFRTMYKIAYIFIWTTISSWTIPANRIYPFIYSLWYIF